MNQICKINTKCEPQLGKRDLYPNTSSKTSGAFVQDLMNVISYLDGKIDLIEISNNCKISFEKVLKIVDQLKSVGLVEVDNDFTPKI
jgi:aminopeptidase-like protein